MLVFQKSSISSINKKLVFRYWIIIFFSKTQLSWSREVILKKVKPVFIIYSFSFQPWQQRKLIENRKADEIFKRLLLVWRKKVTSYGVVYILMCLLWSCKLMLWDFRNFSLLSKSKLCKLCLVTLHGHKILKNVKNETVRSRSCLS